MTKTKSTKRALLLSALSLLLCVSMLVGSTFAWFTDSVTSGNNIIKSGNLDVELEYKAVKDGNFTADWATVKDQDNIFDKNALWEPGRVEVVYLKVSNLGSLALKYQLGVNVISETLGKNEDGEDIRLSEHLVFKVVDLTTEPTAPYTREEAIKKTADTDLGLKDYNGTTTALEVGGEDYVALIVYMPESVGNEANYRGTAIPTINLGINLFATQYTAEEDSFDEFYDKNAWHDSFKVHNASDLQNAINAGETEIMLVADINASEAIVIPEGKTIALNLAGYTLSGNIAKDAGAVLVNKGTLSITGGKVANAASNGAAAIDNNGTLTLDGVVVSGAPIADGGYPEYAVQTAGTLTVENGTVISGDRGAISIDGDGATTINGGVFTANNINQVLTGHVVDLSDDVTGSHTLTINGGTFQHLNEQTAGGVVICNRTTNTVYVNGGNFSGGNYYGNNNLSDYGYRGTFSVKGGTFDAKPATNYITEGFEAVNNGDGTYTVLASGMSVVTNYPGLYTDGTDFYVYNITGLMSLHSYFDDNYMTNSVWTRNYNIMADIDATGYTWNNVYMITGTGDAEGINLLGNGNTISNLTIAGGGMLGGTPNCTNSKYPAYVKNLTFDNVTVTGNAHFAGVVWGGAATCGDVYFEDVHVVNSSVTGKCNVGALIGATGEQSASYDLTISFKDCSVENTTLVATGNPDADPTGASAFIGRAYTNTSLVFEGENIAEGNTITNNNGLVGGGVYGYTIWAGSGFVGTGKCDTFTNWNGIVAVNSSDALTAAVAAGKTNIYLLDGEYNLAGFNGKTVTLSGTKNAVIKVANEGEDGHDAGCDGATVTFNGVTIDTTANGGTYRGFTRMNGTYNDCAFVGTYTTSSGVHKFYNCTFDLRNNYVWTWGASEVLFDNCTFEDANGVGKAILVHQGAATTNVTVRDCTFTASTAAYTWDGLYVAAVSIDPHSADKTITVNFEGTNTVATAEGATADANGNTGFAGLHQIKYENESSQITVKINGETVSNIVATDYNPDL